MKAAGRITAFLSSLVVGVAMAHLLVPALFAQDITFPPSGVANGSITVANLANGVDGELITWDASGAATTIPVGASTQILTSNGPGAVPSWVTPAGLDLTAVDAATWSDGANASNIWTFNVTGTDPTMTFSSGEVNVGGSTLGAVDSTTSGLTVEKAGAGSVFNSQLRIMDSSAVAGNVGGGINFMGKYSGSLYALGAAIKANKVNGTGGNYGFDLTFYTRAHGSSIAEKMRILSTGEVGIGVVAPTNKMEVNGTIKSKTYTVATLPAAATVGAGAEAFVSDANVVHAGNSGNVVAGAGANFVPVYSDGTNWRIN